MFSKSSRVQDVCLSTITNEILIFFTLTERVETEILYINFTTSSQLDLRLLEQYIKKNNNNVIITWRKSTSMHAYPIMAREHEMISTKASIPERMLVGNDVNIIHNSTSNCMNLMGTWHVQVLHHPHHTKWKKINQSLIRVSGPKEVAPFHLMNESPFC